MRRTSNEIVIVGHGTIIAKPGYRSFRNRNNNRFHYLIYSGKRNQHTFTVVAHVLKSKKASILSAQQWLPPPYVLQQGKQIIIGADGCTHWRYPTWFDFQDIFLDNVWNIHAGRKTSTKAADTSLHLPPSQGSRCLVRGGIHNETPWCNETGKEF